MREVSFRDGHMASNEQARVSLSLPHSQGVGVHEAQPEQV